MLIARSPRVVPMTAPIPKEIPERFASVKTPIVPAALMTAAKEERKNFKVPVLRLFKKKDSADSFFVFLETKTASAMKKIK